MPQTVLSGPYSQTKPRVAIISFPWKSHPPYKFLSDLISILEPISEKIVVIDGNTDRIDTAHCRKVVTRDIGISMHYLGDLKPKYFSAVIWILKWFMIQCRASLELARARAEVDVVIFYVAYPGYLLPLVLTKLLRKKSIGVVTHGKATTTIARLWGLQDPILFTLLDGISPESRGLIKQLGIEKYRHKVLPEGARFIDDRRYRKHKRLSERANVVGFIGRMTREKGIIDFVHAIPLVAEQVQDLKFSIVGSGPLSDWVNEQCNRLSTEQGIDISLTNWIETGLADYYNELKLFVLPTYLDAFPTSILEAMACGTPVLATPVGGIPDVIADECTGFLLESTAPDHIAARITKILNYGELDKVADNAEGLIRQKFTRTAATERYNKMLKEVLLDLQRSTA
ncbi:MAG: glycosyltransferase family 4 protein [Euryarchaeota archaeon]|nr:glycosyltransferase family 4 protein [Euryarchaeota archaeon]